MDPTKKSDFTKSPGTSQHGSLQPDYKAEKAIVTITSIEEQSSTGLRRPRWWRTCGESLLRRMSTESVGRRRAWFARAIMFFLVLAFFASIAFTTWTFLCLALIRRLNPVSPRNGLATIVSQWKEPVSDAELMPSWLPSFSSGIAPKPIHSHNDYARDVPLFRALSVGCVGVEADVHLVNGEVFVGHTARDLRTTRTLNSLYLNPLMSILQSQNMNTDRVNSTEPLVGVFNDRPLESLILLLDFKTAPEQTLPAVMEKLRPFVSGNYLTRWNGSNISQGPITIVASGLMSPRLDLQSQTDGFVFLDAPLETLAHANGAFNTSNSLYASVPLSRVVGRVGLWGLDKEQKSQVVELVTIANDSNLKARFWDTPAWPISKRDDVWRQLVDAGVGMLNVDDVRAAALWNWRWCKIAGIRLC